MNEDITGVKILLSFSAIILLTGFGLLLIFSVGRIMGLSMGIFFIVLAIILLLMILVPDKDRRKRE